MKAKLAIEGRDFEVDFSKPVDISLPLKSGNKNVRAFHAPEVIFEPVQAEGFIGSIEEGSPVNFKNIFLNPHGNGTHTECVGHITDEAYTINQCLTEFMFIADLISVEPIQQNGDRVITADQIKPVLSKCFGEALVIRTLPNNDSKAFTDYSGTNPPYIHHEAMKIIVDKGYKHLLVDLPSVDKEQDGGHLRAHKTFWQYPANIREDCTISELIYIPDAIEDGAYLLNLQIISLDLDVSPSKPVLYELL